MTELFRNVFSMKIHLFCIFNAKCKYLLWQSHHHIVFLGLKIHFTFNFDLPYVIGIARARGNI